MQMKGVISVVLFIFLRCHLGSAINCYSCSGECQDNSSKACAQDEQCMIQEFRSDDGKVSDRQMGCLNSQFCKSGNTLANIVQKCCDQDMCNNPKTGIVDTANPQSGAAPNGASDVNRETTLQCYKCKSPCMKVEKTTCKNKEVCVTKTARIVGVNYHERGCANTTVCNTETPEVVAGTTYSIKNKCCDTNLCNSAVHLEVPAVAFLAAIVAAWISKL